MNAQHRWWRLGVVAGLGVTLALTGCGASESGSSSGGGAAAPAAEAPNQKGDAFTGAGAADAQAGGAPPAAAPSGAPAGAPGPFKIDIRSIIYTGDITVRVEKVEQAATQATAIAETAGGFVGSDKRTI